MIIRKFYDLSLRVFLATALATVFAFTLSAHPVDVHSAKRIAERFFQTHDSQLRCEDDQSLRLEAIALRTPDKSFSLLTSEDLLLRNGISVGLASFYVFNRGENKGYIIVAGDDFLTPIVGYALTGRVSLEEVPLYLLGFFEKVNLAIEMALKNGNAILFKEMAPLPAQEVNRSLPKKVEPLLGEIQWDQGHPWNKLCPMVKDDSGIKVKAPVGCVATAMAQIMRFHEWPTKGESSSIYKDKTSGTTLSANYGQTTYNYSQMPKNQRGGTFTETQQNEVAKICLHAGISVEMNYSAYGSGAYSFYVAKALRKYFRYDKSSTIISRNAFSTEEWYSYVYNDLAAGLPVYYAGSGSGGGHAFVFDGYDTDGNVHVNWGWAGMSDGYFNMNLLNPSALGTGGGTGGGFNYYQDCSVNLKPDKNGTSVAPNGILYYDKFIVDVDSKQKKIMLRALQLFVYDHSHYNGMFALGAEPFDGGEMIIGNSKKSMGPIVFGNYYPCPSLTETGFNNLKDGYYLIRPVYKTKKDGQEIWVPLRYFEFWTGASPYRQTLIKVSENGTKWERINEVDQMEKSSISFITNKPTGETFLFNAKGIASAKQSGLESAPVLDGTDQQLVLKSDKVSIEGFFNTLTIQNAGITELFLNATGNLTKLNVRNNEIGYLNAGYMPKIDSLDISYNNVSVLTLGACDNLKYINVTGNPLNPHEMAKIIGKLPRRPSNARGRLIVREVSSHPHANDVWAYSTDVQFAAGKNWWVMTYDPEKNNYAIYKGVPSGIEEITKDNTPKLYPLPAVDKLYLTGLKEGVSIQLYTLAGELVIKQEATSATNVITVAELPRGQYLLVAGNFKRKVLLQSGM